MFRVVVCLLMFLLSAPAWANNVLRVVTTLPDLADWVAEIGGERVEVVSLLNGAEDPHTYEPTVSDVRALARSRVLVKVGLGLEDGLDGLVENASNSELLVVDAGAGLAMEDIATHGDRQPAGGNPHVWLDPANAARMCVRIARELEVADPSAGAYYEERLQDYRKRLREATGEIRTRVAALSDRRFVSYHSAWPYFARAFGFEVVDVVTPIPGQQPSARRIVDLVKKIRAEKVGVLVTEPQLPTEIPDLLAEETGITVVTLSPIVGAGAASDYLAQMRANADTLLRALGDASR